MNVTKYRKRLEAQLAKRDAAPKSASRAMSAKRADSTKARMAAINDMRLDAPKAESAYNQLFETLGNTEEPLAIRAAAFDALKAASFLGPLFAPYRAAYLKCLREVAVDSEPTLREDALEVLAIEKVGYAQNLLFKGLKDPKAALVPPAKAIQLLSYDSHADYAPVIRDILSKTKDTAVKEAAIRFLAADPSSSKLLAKLLQDDSQPAQIRSLCATALRLLQPRLFERIARKIVADDDEDDNLRATCLGALTYVREFRKSKEDPSFVQSVTALVPKTRSRHLRATVKRFLKK